MDYTQKASISKNVKNFNMILICIMGSISLLGLVMAVYSLVHSKFLFSVIYIAAVILGFSYVVMRINTVMPTYIARGTKHIYIHNWNNGLFPFKCDKGFWGDFLPDKTSLKKVDISAVSKIYLGSKNYILKLVSDGELYSKIKNPQKKYESILKRMQFLYILTNDNKEIYMSVTDFDDGELSEVLKPIVESNEWIDFKCNNRVISKSIPPKRITL